MRIAIFDQYVMLFCAKATSTIKLQYFDSQRKSFVSCIQMMQYLSVYTKINVWLTLFRYEKKYQENISVDAIIIHWCFFTDKIRDYLLFVSNIMSYFQ